MAQSTEERRNNHNAACQRYRDRNLDKIRTSARERMRRARRKDNVENMSSTAITNFAALPQDEDRAYHRRRTPGGSGPILNAQEVERAVKAALECDRSQDFRSESHLHHAHNMQVLMATLPPSSEPEYSDSDSSDIHTLPVVTDSSTDEDGCSISDSSETSSNEEREVVLLLTALSDNSKWLKVYIRKQKATAAYKSALRRLEDYQAELATLTQKNTVQPTLDKNPPATIGDEAMD
ncbi:hypothetical protein H0H92_005721, partial [Tricholoma furcatifolium]